MKNERFNFISRSIIKLKLEYFLLVSFILLILLKYSKTELLNNVESEINLIVGKCNTFFLSQNYMKNVGDLPNKIIINGVEEIYSYNIYALNEDKNYITIKFNITIKSCEFMFEDFKDILEIDLSNFDMNEVTSMKYMFNNCKNLKYINLTNINLFSIKNMNSLFKGCNSLTSIDLSNLDASNVEDISYMFDDCTNLQYINLTNIKLTSVEDLSYLFYDCPRLESLDLSNSDLSKVSDMSSIFNEYISFINLSYVNASKIEDMSGLFYNFQRLTTIDLSNSDFSNLNDISYMFLYCENLQYINLTNIKLSSLENMEYLFGSCYSLTSLDLSNLDLSKLRYMGSVFSSCENLEYINLTNIELSSVESLDYSFEYCRSLISLDLSNIDFSNVYFIEGIFFMCYNLRYINLTNTKFISLESLDDLFYNLENLISIDLSNSDFSNANDLSVSFKECHNLLFINLTNIKFSSIENMSCLFKDHTNLISIDLFNSDFSKVKDISHMFENCVNLEYINLTNIKLSSVENTSHLFTNCTSLISIDLSNLELFNTKYISHMFENCYNLEYINLTNIKLSSVEDMRYLFSYCNKLISINLPNLEFSKVQEISHMFEHCTNLKSINFKNMNLSSVGNMSFLFSDCMNLTSIDLSNLILSNVKDITSMFENCHNLEYIDLTNTKLSSAENMSYLFSYCKNLHSLDLSNLNFSNAKNISYMFNYCINLSYLKISNFNNSNAIYASSMFYSCYNLTYLDLFNADTLNMNTATNMFYDCKSLIYLNLNSFKLINSTDIDSIFYGVPSYTKYCIKDNSIEYLLGIKNNDCSHPCFKKNRKLNLDNKTCTELCIYNKILYEYNDICYTKCPKGTLVNGPICENYLNDINNIPQGYYYDSNDELYKKCFDSCKSCNKGGNYEKHNCIECKYDYIFFNESIYETNCYKKCEYYYYFDDLNNYYHCTENYKCPEKYNKLILDKKKCINDCKKDDIYIYEFENKCLINCPKNTFYNENDKICIYYENSIEINNKNSENIIEDNTINIKTYFSSDDIQTTNEILIKDCHYNCKECIEYSSDSNNMKCISCKNGYKMIYGTNNCLDPNRYPTYFIYLDYLLPCSILSSSCYECDPYLYDNIYNLCISCLPGYIYNKNIRRCEICKENEYPITIEKFDSCKTIYSENCELYKTYCISLKNDELEKICEKNNFNIKNGTCIISNKNKIIYINWLNNYSNDTSYPSYNNDKSNYLLIELTIDSFKRKLYFYNEDGRGLFDEINDKYEMIFKNRRAYIREISSSIGIKLNNSEEYKYLLNFENYNNNIELIDIKTGKIFMDDLFNFLRIFDYAFLDLVEKPTTYLLELNENNQFLLATFAKYRKDNKIVILYFIFYLEDSKIEEINIDSLKKIENKILSFNNINFNIYAKFYFIQTERGNIYLSFVSEKNELYYYDIQKNKEYFIYNLTDKISFQKLLLIKKEIKFLSYYSNDKYIVFLIFETINNLKDDIILEYKFNKYLPYSDNNDYIDIIFLSELKAIYILERANSITIFILNFFNDYKYLMKNEYLINIYGNEINNIKINSLLFKYKNILGLQFKNEKENGFILFGYYNSTDPKQILDIKKDGLFYNINLGNYLNLQSNIFDYEIKCIRIIDVPNPNKSGLYLLSNITKTYIKKNDCININTKISLYFSYNGTLKKDNYYFKFVGVLQEPKYEIVQNNSEETFWNIKDISLKNKYIEEYNKRRNINITGRVSLIQINVLNDINVFCDKKYDEFAIKSIEGKLLACGEGKFYDVENMNEITQLNLGNNYYFDKIKNNYIKCHEKCQTCSRKFNSTHMNCDLCIENYFIRNDNCFLISKCEYNYYYDKDFNLNCIKRDEYCPDFKPYENIITKECIENCSIIEYNKECNPTNNKNAIKNTYKNILDNIKYLNLEEKLFINKTKYIIYGNNVTFIFTTSEIEKEELNNNFNNTSIILSESENYIKKYYSINEELPIPILKIETLNNHSNDIELYYDLFNPKNLTQKLDLNLIEESHIEIIKPKYLKQYKMDVILKTRDLGYNIFDLNDSFYNDICSVFSYNNTDFSLSERKNIIDLSDEILCSNIYNYSCNYTNFDIKTLRSICICKIGFNENNTIENKNENNKNEINNLVNLVKQNMNISKSSNIRVVKCFSIIFRKNLFIENYGFYIMFALLIINFITLIYSPISKIEKILNEYCNEILIKMKLIYSYDIDELKDKILQENENFDKNNSDLIIENNTFPENKDVKKNIKQAQNKPISIINNSHKFKIKKSIKKKRILNLITSNSNDFSKEKSDNSFKNIKMNNSNIILHKDKSEEEIIKKLKEKNNSDFYIYKVIKGVIPEKRKEYLSEYEIGGLSYKNALLIEDRDNSDYYFALLQEKNKIISTFLNNEDYNIQSIKISSFILEFVLSLTVNALFYSDEAIYEINQEKEDTSVISKYSRVIYSAIISGFLNFIIESLAFSHKKIIGLRSYKEIKDVEEEIPKIINKLKIKCITYYALSLFLNIIFLYYITAFCAIYTIIQINMISDASMSFLLAMSYSIILSLLTSIIRIFSLQTKNKFRHFLYILSWIISLI